MYRSGAHRSCRPSIGYIVACRAAPSRHLGSINAITEIAGVRLVDSDSAKATATACTTTHTPSRRLIESPAGVRRARARRCAPPPTVSLSIRSLRIDGWMDG